MKISVIGCGYLGAVHASALSSLGHTVTGIDTDPARAAQLAAGSVPFHEPGLEPLLQAGLRDRTLHFTTDPAAAAGADVHFLCVGTPQEKTTRRADLGYVTSAVRDLAAHLRPGSTVVGKSTIPAGTSAILTRLLAGTGADLGWNPEFLRQGTAVADSLQPDRLVYGVPDGTAGARVARVLDEVYAPLLHDGVPRLITGLATAELTKSAANAFLALKISYLNGIAELCENAGGDVVHLARALGLDARIGPRYLQAGAGFGGGCLPKDLRSLQAQAEDAGAGSLGRLLALVDTLNTETRHRIHESARQMCGGQLAGRRITVLGAAFKPDTDDVRDSPALDIALRLARSGAVVTVTDPQAAGQPWFRYPELRFEPDTAAALRGADLTVLLTEWAEYLALDPREVSSLVDRCAVLDGRNALDAAAWRSAGWFHRGIGRGRRAGLSTVEAAPSGVGS
ncbi:UDP-glucose dehydrogenase family protein [Arthrobacter sp. TMN-37]